MRIGYCQIDVINSDIDRNLERINELLKDVAAEILVLPELCVTGYYFANKSDLLRLSSDSNKSKVINAFTEIAKKKNTYLIAGVAERENNKLYNSAIIIGPNGIIGNHRKINLTKNETIFSRGEKLDIFTVGGVNIGINICFESWFPESFRVLALKGAQIICCPSNFGGPWTLDVMKVRSLENKVFTIMCNRIGSEMIDGEKAEFRGESQVIDFGGNVLIRANQEECVGIVEINPEEVKIKDNIICNDMEYEMNLYRKYISYKL